MSRYRGPSNDFRIHAPGRFGISSAKAVTSETTRHDSLTHAASAMSGPMQPQMPRLATIPLPSATKSEQRATYSANSPDGQCLQIPKELFTALRDFLDGEKPAGSITIHFRNGGIAGVEALIKKYYK